MHIDQTYVIYCLHQKSIPIYVAEQMSFNIGMQNIVQIVAWTQVFLFLLHNEYPCFNTIKMIYNCILWLIHSVHNSRILQNKVWYSILMLNGCGSTIYRYIKELHGGQRGSYTYSSFVLKQKGSYTHRHGTQFGWTGKK